MTMHDDPGHHPPAPATAAAHDPRRPDRCRPGDAVGPRPAAQTGVGEGACAEPGHRRAAGLRRLLGGALWLESALHRQAALTDYPSRPASGHGTTWLLVGSDSRQGLTVEQQEALATGGDIGNGRTDTILLVHIPGPGIGDPDHFRLDPARLRRADSRLRSRQDRRGLAIGGAPLLAQRSRSHWPETRPLRRDRVRRLRGYGRCLRRGRGGPTAPIGDPLAGIDLPAGCQELGGAQRTRLCPFPGHPAGRPRPNGRPAAVHGRADAPCRSPTVRLDPRRWYSCPRPRSRR